MNTTTLNNSHTTSTSNFRDDGFGLEPDITEFVLGHLIPKVMPYHRCVNLETTEIAGSWAYVPNLGGYDAERVAKALYELAERHALDLASMGGLPIEVREANVLLDRELKKLAWNVIEEDGGAAFLYEFRVDLGPERGWITTRIRVS